MRAPTEGVHKLANSHTHTALVGTRRLFLAPAPNALLVRASPAEGLRAEMEKVRTMGLRKFPTTTDKKKKKSMFDARYKTMNARYKLWMLVLQNTASYKMLKTN